MGEDHYNSKAELRRELNERGRGPTDGEAADRSNAVCRHVVSAPAFETAEHVVAYAARSGEVDPAVVVAAANEMRRPTYFPRVEGGHLRFRRALPTELVPGRFGIPEPSADRPVLDPSAHGVVFLVPGLAFDRAGTRLGSGFGYYDRAFAADWARATRIGLVFAARFLDRLPRDPWDVPMHLVATENGLFAADGAVGVLSGDS